MESSGKAGRLKRQRYHYFADKPESHQEDQTQLQYTNLICGTVVTPETVPWWGFSLRHDDHLPGAVIRAIHSDPSVLWETEPPVL